MSEQTQGTSGGAAVSTRETSRGGSALSTSRGTTTIADVVVSKIAGIATHEINGVHAMGSGTARAFGAIRERIPGSTTNQSQGVQVEVGETQAAIDVAIVAEYGVAITDLAEGIRRNVINAVERMTGLEVVEVNIDVVDIHLPQDDSQQPEQEPRVQ
ncbi:Asp23/Gls24 family envelope stress response protein [Georgenia thermotolerans]|uniref:Asp23/Gls24 family envelope stress response protein n=1 Tax=Georgenia thermotolerans TaxID=527326 RepID=A0A7J5USP3_9MICO|nr:Asp23/Gls24 family envelope stress response protein [Georgenia thermotolerans]KAE8765472.1 Asp23/Gls24 family envelope stress response protein [Georgenia thermotolerans]